MGLFFKRELAPTDKVESALAAAFAEPQQAQDEAATTAKDVVKKIRTDPGADLNAFGAAGIVFLVLLVAAFVGAQLADAQIAEKTFTQSLASLTQTLLTAWSAAVLGLIGGEAIGT